MKKLISIFILLMTISSFAQFKLPKKADWEIANTKPIILLQLPADDSNAEIFNLNLKSMLSNTLELQEFLKF